MQYNRLRCNQFFFMIFGNHRGSQYLTECLSIWTLILLLSFHVEKSIIKIPLSKQSNEDGVHRPKKVLSRWILRLPILACDYGLS